MDSNQTLEVKIKTTANEASQAIDKVVKSLSNTENLINNIYLELGQMEKKMDNVGKSTKNTNNNAKQLKDTMDDVLDASKVKAFINELKRVISFTNKLLQASIDYSEQLNLFNVTFGNNMKDGKTYYSEIGLEATKFKNTMVENFGLAGREVTKFMALFQAMGTSSGIGEKYASVMSQGTTQLVYDLASLYNKEQSVVAEALRAGIYAGQTKPLRTYGIDVTETSLKPILQELGIDRSLSDMSQGEKQILRYIAALRQAKIAMGDYANTIESPANQQKVFNNLIDECKVALGTLIQWIYAKVLPYLNALLMVVKAIAYALINLFGINMEDYNSGIASTEDIFSDLGDDIDDANGKAKALKRTLLGFDQVNNITTPTSTSGSAGIGTIDQRLLDYIQSYENGLTKVKMKATEISESILEWLGISKKVNEETGEIEYKFEKLTPGMIAIAGIAATLAGKTLLDILGLVGSIGAKATALSGTLGTIGTVLATLNLLFLDVAVWALVIYYAGKLKENIEGLHKDYDGIVETTQGWVESTKELNKEIEKLSDNGGLTDKKLNAYVITLTNNSRVNKGLIQQVKEQNTLIGKLSGGYGRAREALEENIILQDQYIEQMKEVKEKYGLTNEQMNRYINLLKDQEEAMSIINETGLAEWDIYQDLAEAYADMARENGLTTDQTREYTEALIKERKAIESSDLSSKSLHEAYEKLIGNYDTLKESVGLTQQQQEEYAKVLKSQIELNEKLGYDTTELKKKYNDLTKNKYEIKLGIKDDITGAWNTIVAKIKGTTFNISTNMATGEVRINKNGGIFANGSWSNIPQYANGGSPSHGTMFVAGEAGAEVVGHINGRTEVLNQSQLASVMYSAVSAAMSQNSGSGVEVYVHTDEGTIVDRINRTTKQTGVCPINIPV